MKSTALASTKGVTTGFLGNNKGINHMNLVKKKPLGKF
jgi:hypothetical protein